MTAREPCADVAARAAAPIGATFAGVCLVTGSIWGAPTWGTWWEWDGRLTSMLVLFVIYLGYIALWAAIDDEERAGKLAAILCLAGLINLPIIKFSVDWWSTLHQPASVFRAGGSSIAPAMMGPLMTMAGAYLFLFAALTPFEAAALGAQGILVPATCAAPLTTLARCGQLGAFGVDQEVPGWGLFDVWQGQVTMARARARAPVRTAAPAPALDVARAVPALLTRAGPPPLLQVFRL